jgi:DNA-binding MurR/RpiR family transcriptional regulator
MTKHTGSKIHERIQGHRPNFTPAQERIANYLLTHTLEAALLTATALAQQVEVDPATVVRFAQKLGYAGYLELKDDLGRWVRDEEHENIAPLSSLGQALEITRTSLSSEFDRLWDSLAPSDLIPLAELLGTPCCLLILADKTLENMARWLTGELQTLGFKIETPVSDPEALAASMLKLEGYDRALLIEGTLPSPTLGHLSQELNRKGIRSLAILGSASSQIAYQANLTLLLPPLRRDTTLPTLLQQLFGTILQAVDRLRSTQLDHVIEAEDQEENPQGAVTP